MAATDLRSSTSRPAAGPGPDQLERPDWLGRDQWPFTLRSYCDPATPDRAMHYIDEGTGPVLVMVHVGLWSFVWRDLIAELRSDFRCLALDPLGFGLSARAPGSIDLAALPPVMNRWLDHLGIERATLVIHDLGGSVGIAAADRFRQSRQSDDEPFTGLVAVNTFAWPPRSPGLRAMLGFMGSGLAERALGASSLVPRLTGTGFGVGRHLDPADRRAFMGPFRDSPDRGRNFHRAMASAARSGPFLAGTDASLRTTLRHLPVLTVFGGRNDPFGFGHQWKERFPAARQEIIAGGNHFPMCDDPTLVASWIRSWRRQYGE